MKLELLCPNCSNKIVIETHDPFMEDDDIICEVCGFVSELEIEEFYDGETEWHEYKLRPAD